MNYQVTKNTSERDQYTVTALHLGMEHRKSVPVVLQTKWLSVVPGISCFIRIYTERMY